jgi:hypothetical protein
VRVVASINFDVTYGLYRVIRTVSTFVWASNLVILEMVAHILLAPSCSSRVWVSHAHLACARLSRDQQPLATV